MGVRFMNKFTLLVVAVSSVAFGYSTDSQKVEMNRSQVVNATNSKQVSLSLSVKTRTSEFPVIVNQSKNKNCSHKQTLLMYSGYDMANRLHIRTYEIQISNNAEAKTVCQIAILTEKNMTLQESARVTVLF
jgi:hypothetical protein